MDTVFVRKDKLNLSATKLLDASLVVILVNDEYRSLRAVLNPKNSPGKVSPQVFYHPHWPMRVNVESLIRLGAGNEFGPDRRVRFSLAHFLLPGHLGFDCCGKSSVSARQHLETLGRGSAYPFLKA
jgi:hypothetical protein